VVIAVLIRGNDLLLSPPHCGLLFQFVISRFKRRGGGRTAGACLSSFWLAPAQTRCTPVCEVGDRSLFYLWTTVLFPSVPEKDEMEIEIDVDSSTAVVFQVIYVVVSRGSGIRV